MKTNETMTNSNPYVAHLMSKGYSAAECVASPAPKADYPRTIYGRTYQTEEDYNEAMHDFLNGM